MKNKKNLLKGAFLMSAIIIIALFLLPVHDDAQIKSKTTPFVTTTTLPATTTPPLAITTSPATTTTSPVTTLSVTTPTSPTSATMVTTTPPITTAPPIGEQRPSETTFIDGQKYVWNPVLGWCPDYGPGTVTIMDVESDGHSFFVEPDGSVNLGKIVTPDGNVISYEEYQQIKESR